MKKILTTVTIATGIFTWILFGIYKYCSSSKLYWVDLGSSFHQIGSKSINLAAVLSLLGIALSTFLIGRYEKNAITIGNIVITFTIAFWMWIPVVLDYLGFILG